MDMFENNSTNLSNEKYELKGGNKVHFEDRGDVDQDRVIFRDMLNGVDQNVTVVSSRNIEVEPMEIIPNAPQLMHRSVRFAEVDTFDDNTKSLSDEEYGLRGEKEVCPEDSGSVDRERAIFRE
eukprot:7078606-Ditylum_brightwellii.AAC.1